MPNHGAQEASHTAEAGSKYQSAARASDETDSNMDHLPPIDGDNGRKA